MEGKLKVALCAIVKNENLYIREWLEYYKNLGISKIFLYDNNEINGERLEDVIGDYISSSFVDIIDRRGKEKGLVYFGNINLQPLTYIDCYEDRLSDFDWVCFFDIDEFLEFRNGFDMFSFLQQSIFDDCGTILVGHETYGDNDLDMIVDQLLNVLQSYLMPGKMNVLLNLLLEQRKLLTVKICYILFIVLD